MSLVLPIADHGDIVAALPFVLPAFLIVATLIGLRAFERKRDSSER